MHQIQIADRQGSDSHSHRNRYRYIKRFYYIQVPVGFPALPLTIIMRASHEQLGGPRTYCQRNRNQKSNRKQQTEFINRKWETGYSVYSITSHQSSEHFNILAMNIKNIFINSSEEGRKESKGNDGQPKIMSGMFRGEYNTICISVSVLSCF